MEDMARLALIEQNMKDSDRFIILLYELLNLLTYMIENPHDFEARALKSEIILLNLKTEGFEDYLKYIGFTNVNGFLFYPTENPISRLRMALAAVQRKINFCSSVVTDTVVVKPNRPPKIIPVNILKTNNALLLKLEALFNNILKYEDEELQREARSHIPLGAIQLKAIDRIRENQARIKLGELKGPEMAFDIAQLIELMHWFKNKFFSWTDKPPCDRCKSPTRFIHSSMHSSATEMYTVEVYQCLECRHRVYFPRYNDPGTLLTTRRGRCGEWANCFTLLCRTLGYDTRYVYDTTDHVWCEVYDYDSKMWLHVDPCEARLNAPLLYSHGWGKKISYVLAVSRDDLQDVTWRYTYDHKEVLRRRSLAKEPDLLAAILLLRERRHRQLTEHRRRYLAKRNAEELAQLLAERKPTDYESQGRISGSSLWRLRRREMGPTGGHTFEFDSPGEFVVGYYPMADEYRITGQYEPKTLKPWSAGAHEITNMRRKLEHDWQKVYLSREDGSRIGVISWRLTAGDSLSFTSLCVRASDATYEDGNVAWTVRFDTETPEKAFFGESPLRYERYFKTVLITAELEGGRGDVAWQHAQLFRLDASSPAAGFQILASVCDTVKVCPPTAASLRDYRWRRPTYEK